MTNGFTKRYIQDFLHTLEYTVYQNSVLENEISAQVHPVFPMSSAAGESRGP